MDRPRLPARAGADLRACLDSIAEGRRGTAVDLARALAADPERLTRFIGARLLYLLRLYQEALDALEEHLRAHGDDAYALRLRYSLLKRLRFEQEGGGALGALLRVADDARVHEAAVLHFQGMGRPQIALAHLGRVLRAKDGAAHQYRAQLRLAVDAGDLDTARRAATRALQLDPARWLDVVDKLLEAGFFDLAEREADRHVETPEGRAVLGQLALFGGAWSRAYEHASSACERDPGCERAIAVMVGASVMGGDLDRAERDLARRRGDLGPTLRTWLAEILLRRNDLAGARRELTRVQNEVPDYFPAKLLWVLVKGELDREEWATLSAYDGLLEGQIQALGIELPVADGRIAASTLAAAAAEALALLKGNRSPFPSVVRGGELQSVRVPRGARHRVREVQHATPWIGIDRAKAEVVAELARIGPHPIAECYEAELYLWAGDYDAARGKFERILAAAPRTTWAWIGLGASLRPAGRRGARAEHPGRGGEGDGVPGSDAARLPRRSALPARAPGRGGGRARGGLSDASQPRRGMGPSRAGGARAGAGRGSRRGVRAPRRRRHGAALGRRESRAGGRMVAGLAECRDAAAGRRAGPGADARQPFVELRLLVRAGHRRDSLDCVSAARHHARLGSRREAGPSGARVNAGCWVVELLVVGFEIRSERPRPFEEG